LLANSTDEFFAESTVTRVQAEADFTTIIETLEALEESAVNEVDSALLLTARHELSLYDLSHWAEDIQLCSKATLSRGKSDFEYLEVVNIEKVPTDIGRLRQRFTLTEEYTTLSESELLREINAVKID
jgi:hypothetical protein